MITVMLVLELMEMTLLVLKWQEQPTHLNAKDGPDWRLRGFFYAPEDLINRIKISSDKLDIG